MNIFWKRYFEIQGDLTEDEIFKTFKFTNVYRSLDRVSQYLIGNVLYNEKGLNNDYDTEDIFWRTILFKHFNKIETWEALIEEFGDITLDIKISELDEFLSSIEGPIYSNAYMMTASFMNNEKIMKKYGIKPNSLKHSAYLQIWGDVLLNGKMYEILRSKSLREVQENLNSIITVGGFISMQYAIDLNYSILFDFDENDHIIAGPGAIRGIEGTFDIEGKPDYIEIIKWVNKELFNLLNDYKISFDPIPGRDPKLIDIQNCFCETSKYLKGINPGDEPGQKRIKNVFKPKNEKIKYFFPPKWKLEI